jgi:23S rRNA pseudouridine1911/1915/1917 synthase
VPGTEWGWLIVREELDAWILQHTPDLLVVNKPAGVVCHPSRYGPWSSLIGACREYLRCDRLHMPYRLDRETSGVMVFATSREAGRRLQRAVLRRSVRKTYTAILEGELRDTVAVDMPIGQDADAAFFSRRTVAPDGQAAQTVFVPKEVRGGYTLVEVHPATGHGATRFVSMPRPSATRFWATSCMDRIPRSCWIVSGRVSMQLRWTGCP